MELIYVVEIIILIVSIIVAILKLRKKSIKKLWSIIMLILGIFVVIIGATIIIQNPKIEISDKTTIIEANKQNKLEKPKTLYMFQEITDKIEIIGDVDYNKIGEYEITYKVHKVFGDYEQKQTVKVVDTTAPEIKLEGEEEYNISYTKQYSEPGYTAIDAHDGDLTQNVSITEEIIDETHKNIIYTVEDSSGNIAHKTRKICVIDDVPPAITLNGSSSMTLLIGKEYEEKGAKAVDEKDGNLTDKIIIEGNVNTSKEGKYEIIYKVSDSKGNTAEKVRKVSVIKKELKAQTGVDGEPGVIYLTFDDGPSSNITPKILDILKKKNVKATFFVLNYNSAGEELIKREIAEGHTVGIHGYSHEYNKIYQSVDTYMENITKLQEKIKKSTGYNAKITRFPGGSSNKVSNYNPGIMTILCSEVVERGYKYFDWNVSSGDAGGAKTSEQVYNNVIKGLSKKRANVVLMHDFSGNTKTLNALEDIINYGIENGYTFKNITEETPMVTHKPNN